MGAEAWADALHRWLGMTESRMHIVNSGKDAAAVPRNIDCLIISYNFVQKMVRCWLRLKTRVRAGDWPPTSVCLPACLQDLAKQFRVGERLGAR